MEGTKKKVVKKSGQKKVLCLRTWEVFIGAVMSETKSRRGIDGSSADKVGKGILG